MDEYITIAEFSRRAGISKQRVYQLLNKDLNKGLNKFVKVVDNRKMLHIQALDEYGLKGACSNLKGVEQPLEQGVEQGDTTPSPTTPNELNATLELLKSTIAILEGQLKEKDKTIHELTEALKTEQLQTSQAQALHGGSLKQLLGETEQATPSPSVEVQTDAPGEAEPLHEEQKKEAEAPRSLWRILFRK